VGNIEALDFNGADLVGVDFNFTPRVYSFNQGNGAPTLLATSNANTGSVRSGAILNPNTMLIRGDDPVPTLYSIALASGTTTSIGPMGNEIYGMDFIGSTLYGVGGTGNLFKINPATGAATQYANVGNQFFLSLATIPVPEPSAFVLAILAAIGLVWWGRGRRTA
jgi:hypothetical protein